MKKYARIDSSAVVEIILPVTRIVFVRKVDAPPVEDGEIDPPENYDQVEEEIPIEERFHPDIVATLRDITNQASVTVGWVESNGVLSAPPAPAVESVDEIRARALAEIRDQRAPLLDALTGIGFDAMAAGDDSTTQAASSCRQSLKDITSTPGFVAAQTYDDMKAAIMVRYAEIASAAPDAVKTAFASLLS